MADFGQHFGKRGSRERREGRQKTDQKKGGGTINIVHVLCEGVAGRRRLLHTKHGLCPPLGFQRTYMSSIAGVLGFRASGFWRFGFLVFRFQGLGRQGETKNQVTDGKLAKILKHNFWPKLVRPKSVAHRQRQEKCPMPVWPGSVWQVGTTNLDGAQAIPQELWCEGS